MQLFSAVLSGAAIDPLSSYMLIIEASIIVILSAVFTEVARKTNIPSVLLLIALGIGIQVLCSYLHIQLWDLMPMLEILGVVGLIMIVLEAALDLELARDKLPIIGKSLVVAFLALILSVFGLAGIIQAFFPMNFMNALVYATPLSIMSSAIIIPSVGSLVGHKREFMIYESTFSDILGIMLFYLLLSMVEIGSGGAFMEFGLSLVLTILVAVGASYLLIFIFKDLKGHARLFLLISILLLLYAAGKLLHLSPLLIILVFGLALANHRKFFGIFRNHDSLHDPIDTIEHEFHLITLETAFVVRTFFFVIFGMTIQLSSLVSLNVLFVSLLLLVVLYAVRYILLKLFIKKDILPELWIAPRGLITILLFFAIPQALQVEQFDSGTLLFVIIISSLVMTYGLIRNGKKNSPVKKEETSEVAL